MNLDRLTNLIASGIPAAQVASILGVSPARISQLCSQEDIKGAIEAKIVELNAGNIEAIALDAKYHSAEHALIDQVTSMASMAELRDVTAALRVISERQTRKEQIRNPIPVGLTNNNGVILNQVIQLSLPNHALPEMILTKQKEIISIGERNLAPLNSTGVTALFKKLDHKPIENKGENNDTDRILRSPEETLTESSQEAEAFLAEMRG